MDDAVTLDRSGDVAVVTLRQPPHNLLTEPLLRALADAVHEAADGARVAVLCSEGRSFCAGANFRAPDAPDPTAAAQFSYQTSGFYAQAARIFASPIPIVAAVQGAAIGAGLGLALACDVRVVGERGWFQANFVRLGIHPGFAISFMLPRMVGPGRASDMLLTARRVEAPEALAMGLCERVVPAGTELESAREVAEEIARGAPLALAATRATQRHGLAEVARATMTHELAEQTRLAGTEDAIEGVAAMLAGRHPRFSGR